MSSEWNITCSEQAARIFNPIRAISDHAKPSTSTKNKIQLTLGDPTIDGNLPGPRVQTLALQEAITSGKHDGYAPSVGAHDARQAVADYWKKHFVSQQKLKGVVRGDRVVLTSGGSHAILLAITALCNAGDNVLIPAPGFPHYVTVCKAYGIEPLFYTLHPDQDWEADINEIKQLRNEKTKMLIMTNPSNPCGSNWRRAHVEEMVKVAEEIHLPLFSDEIYAGMVFQGAENPTKEFTSVLDIDTVVPRIVLGGTAKTFVVPGWRLGWLIVVDPAGVGAAIYEGIAQQANLIVGPNTLAQAALPATLMKTPASYLPELVAKIEKGAHAFYHALSDSPIGPHPPSHEQNNNNNNHKPMLSPTRPQAAMYVMVRIHLDEFDQNAIHSDRSFFELLLEEENVQVIPGEAFGAHGCFRVVITRPVEVLEEAVARMVNFCERHRRPEGQEEEEETKEEEEIEKEKEEEEKEEEAEGEKEEENEL